MKDTICYFTVTVRGGTVKGNLGYEYLSTVTDPNSSIRPLVLKV